MLEFTSTITAVTVFSQGAQIERRVALTEGPLETLQVLGLPLTMLDESVVLRVEGAEPRPVVLDYRVILQANRAEAEGDLERRIEAARQDSERLLARQSVLQQLRRGLTGLHPRSRPQNSEGAPVGTYQVESQMELLAFRERETARLESELAEVETALNQANELFAALRHESERQAPEARPGALEKGLTVSLRGQAGAGTVLVVQYRVPGACWAPAYSLSLSSSLDSAELTMRAMIAQHTGEDWSAVQLTLSTANPNEWRDLPEWKSLRIGRDESAHAPSWFPPPAGADALFAEFDACRARLATANTTLSPGKPAPPPPPPPPVLAQAPKLEVGPPPEPEHAPEGASIGGGAAYPQIAPVMAAPAPMKRRAPFGAKLGSLSPPEPSELSSDILRRSRSGGSQDHEQDDGGGAREHVELVANQRYLRYQSLRLLDFSSADRGQLVVREQLEEYAEFSTLEWSASDVARSLRTAEITAARIGTSLSPPPGHAYPRAQDGFDYSYQGEAPVDVPSDGLFHSVPVFVTNLAPTVSYIANPRRSQQVFREAVMTNSTGRALPEGPADISVGGDFLHTTPLRGVTPEGVLRLGLGVEQSVKISRNVHFKESTSGLMGGTAELSHTIEVEVVNHRPQDVVVEVRERLPEPSTENKDEMKVLLTAVQPAWESYQPEDDHLMKAAYSWKLPVPSGGKASARVTYLIEMPAKYQLMGGNRREQRL